MESLICGNFKCWGCGKIYDGFAQCNCTPYDSDDELSPTTEEAAGSSSGDSDHFSDSVAGAKYGKQVYPPGRSCPFLHLLESHSEVFEAHVLSQLDTTDRGLLSFVSTTCRAAVVASPLPCAGLTPDVRTVDATNAGLRLPFNVKDFMKSVEMLKWAKTGTSAYIMRAVSENRVMTDEIIRYSEWLVNYVHTFMDKKYEQWTIKQNGANDIS